MPRIGEEVAVKQMEAVSLESLPPEDSDLYIPNLSDVQVQNTSSLSNESGLQQSMHLSAIRYTPSASTSPPIPPPLVATQTPGSLIQGIYRTTFTTQVIAAQTFHYPPTPPIDGHVSDRNEKHLQQTEVENQSAASITPNVVDSELPVSSGLDKPINPFPSPLPTPPDMESLHQHTRNGQQQRSVEDLQNSVSKMVAPTFSGPQQQWAAQQAVCFMPQAAAAAAAAAASCGTQLLPYSTTSSVSSRRCCPPAAPVPALQQMCYSAAVSNPLAFNDPRCGVSPNTAIMGEMLKKIPTMPALVKDGEFDKCRVHFYVSAHPRVHPLTCNFFHCSIVVDNLPILF